MKPIYQERGKFLLNKAIEKMREINKDSDLTYKFSKLILFGSLLKESDTVGDVDIICVITRVKLSDESNSDFRIRDQALAEQLEIPRFMMDLRSCNDRHKN
jgi:predicted nucleotidyltransferase